MTLKEVMEELKSMGTAQNRKIYKRHGAGDNMYGVSFANLNKLKKKLKGEHELGVQLWETGNVDAQSLATMIMDPAKLTRKQIEKWVNEVDYSMLADLLIAVIRGTDFYQKDIDKWAKSKKELVRRTGYHIISQEARHNEDLGDKFFENYLDKIEKEIQTSPNKGKEGMNTALVTIGLRNSKLKKKAIAVAKKVGKIEIDHGETNCKTYNALMSLRSGKLIRT